MKYAGKCILVCDEEDSSITIEKRVEDFSHVGWWHLTNAIIQAIKAFDAANPPGKGETTLAERVKEGLK